MTNLFDAATTKKAQLIKKETLLLTDKKFSKYIIIVMRQQT